MRRLTGSAAASVLVAGIVSGCSGGGSGDAERPRPSDVTIESGGYAYGVPDDWRETTGSVAGTDTAAIDGDDKDGFADGVSVIVVDPAPETDPDAIEDASISQLDDSSAEGVQVLQRRDVDGSVGVHLAGSLEVRGNSYDIEQFVAVRANVSYVVTFSFSPDLSRKARDDVIDTVLDSWTWSVGQPA